MSDAETEPEDGEEEGGGSSKIVVILTALNVLITLGIGGLVYMQFKKEQTIPQVSDIQVHEGSEEGDGGGHGEGESAGAGEKLENKTEHDFGRTVTLEQFTVNLATTGTIKPKFARVNIAVSVASEDTEMELTTKMPQVRNTVIDLFNSKRPEDLQNPEGRNLLKEQIQNAFNSFLITGKVTGVFFTSFALSS